MASRFTLPTAQKKKPCSLLEREANRLGDCEDSVFKTMLQAGKISLDS